VHKVHQSIPGIWLQESDGSFSITVKPSFMPPGLPRYTGVCRESTTLTVQKYRGGLAPPRLITPSRAHQHCPAHCKPRPATPNQTPNQPNVLHQRRLTSRCAPRPARRCGATCASAPRRARSS
jgi:hypothetical protein